MSAPPGPTHGTFLLGLGAQKAGTAWLHRYLQDSPACDPGFQKEYHLWDVVDLPHMKAFGERVLARARRSILAMEAGGPGKADQLRLATFYADHTTYFDYFQSLLARDDDVRLTADITPSYASLSTDRLSSIRSEMARRGVRTVALLSMRDPLQRCLSAARMYRERDPQRYPGTVAETVEAIYRTPATQARSGYDVTLARMDAAFAQEDRITLFYEQMFDQAVLDRTCERLGIRPHAADLGRRVNATARPAEDGLPDDLARRVVAHYAGVYEVVAGRHPELDLAAVWPSAELL